MYFKKKYNGISKFSFIKLSLDIDQCSLFRTWTKDRIHKLLSIKWNFLKV